MLNVALIAGNPVFARSNAAALINYSATYAVTFLLSLYLQYVRGLDPGRAGLVLLTQSVVMAAVSPFAGRLSDRIEPRIVASIGMALTVAGLAWLCLLEVRTPLAVIFATLVVLGAGFGLFSSPNTNAVMSAVSRTQYGVASATLGTMRLRARDKLPPPCIPLPDEPRVPAKCARGRQLLRLESQTGPFPGACSVLFCDSTSPVRAAVAWP